MGSFIRVVAALLALAGTACGLSDVFSAGEGGYFCIKIPEIVVTRRGTLVAFGEARRPNCSDYTWTDLVTKRSVDGGRTWTALVVVHSNSTATDMNVVGNAAPVVLRATGRIVVPFNRNNRDAFITYSDDDGDTWAPVAPMQNATRPEWGWIGFGPPAALELASGRVVIPAYHSTAHDVDGTFTQGHAVISDDCGATWRLGGVFEDTLNYPNEAQAVEVAPDVVAVFSRGLLRKRLRTVSRDGGVTFAAPEVLASLPQPTDGCEGSTIAVKNADTAEAYLLYTGLHTDNLIGLRSNMSVHTSADDGRTWTARRVLNSGPSGYSSAVQLPGAPPRVGVVYERSDTTRFIFIPDHISYVEVPLGEGWGH